METNKNYRLVPRFGTAYGTGWQVMSDNFLRFLLVIIVLGLVATPMSIFNIGDHHDFSYPGHFPDSFEHFMRFSAIGLAAAFLGFMGLLYSFLVLPVFRYGARMMFLQGVRGQVPDFEQLISGFRKNYLNIVLANLLVCALVGIGLVCIIIPGIIIACRLVFTPYLVMDRGLDPIQAVEESWRLTRGHGWKIFFMGFITIFLFIGGLICLFFGVLVAFMWIKSAYATLYQSVLLEKGLVVPAEEPAV
jgi:uncharacterized membrane protein